MATKKVTTKKSTTTTAKRTAKKASAKANELRDEIKQEVTEFANDVNELTDDVIEEATSAFESISKNIDTAQGVAKQVWFAYLGAVGRSFEEIQSRVTNTSDDLKTRYEQINKDSQKLVEDLVSRGEQVQGDAEVLLKESRVNIEEQIEVAKTRLSSLVSVVDIPARLQDMSDKLESLSKDLKKSA